VFRSSTLRIAVFYTLAFSAATAVLGVVMLLATRAALGDQFNNRILSESAAMVQQFHVEGLKGLEDAVRERAAAPGALDVGLQGPDGSPIVGDLAEVHTRMGWSTVVTSEPGEGEQGPSRIFATTLPTGHRLLVGDDIARVDAVDGVVVRSFGIAFIGVLVAGSLGGYTLSRGIHRRVVSITRTAEAIIDGDLSRRVPVRGADDELGRLAGTLNRMLDRIGGLLDSLRQVSTDVAHDLRTPLTRLRQKLETMIGETGDEDRREALESAVGDLDSILATFTALLRISQIEGGERRAAFRRLDLVMIADTVVEAFRPSAELIGQTLELVADGPVMLDGDKELLTQMIANLIENAIRHAGQGAAIRVACTAAPGPCLSVLDNGPGVPVEERTRLFDRFYRLETSRSTPGSGLGLALVSAVARLHGAEASLHDAGPGLEARISFPGAS
jgi:signal transduction histidine kinase